MTIEIKVPDIGADPVDVTEILVKVGDKIEVDQSLITVEGDKASMEVPASESGVVQAIKVAVGDKVETGSLIMIFDAESEGVPAPSSVPSEAPIEVSAPEVADSASTAIESVSVPDIGSDAVVVTEVMVAVGDEVEAEQSLITVEGDKASMEVPAPFAGKVAELKIKVGDKVETGSLIMLFEISSSVDASKASAPPSVAAEQALAAKDTAVKETAPKDIGSSVSPASNVFAPKLVESDFSSSAAYVHATPVVRRLAREFGVDLSQVKATGRKNRILKEDVQQFVKSALQQTSAARQRDDGVGLGLLPWPSVDFNKFGETERSPLSRIKKLTGANLARNWVMIPHVTQWDNADITDLEAFRKEQNALEAKKNSGIKITPLVFIMKVVASALEAFPTFNSSLSDDGEALILKKYINIGIAVDTPNGLVVPVVRDVNQKGIYELSSELAEISKKARDGKLTASDMQGGCFTISSLGGIGGTAFTPIINAPEVAILGVSKSQIQPVWNGKEFMPRLQLPLSLSYDHRVIDGAEGARFIYFLNQGLSDIRRLIL